MLAIHTRLMKEVGVPEFALELTRDLALWKLRGAMSKVSPPAELTPEQRLTAVGIVAGAWGRMADTALPPCASMVLGPCAETMTEVSAMLYDCHDVTLPRPRTRAHPCPG